MTWQNGRMLSKATKSGTTVTYDYDVSGIRTTKVEDGFTYEYVTQSGRLVYETATGANAAYVMYFAYDESGRPFSIKFSKDGGASFSTYYYVLNLQGDVVKIVAQGGTVVGSYEYDAWGRITSMVNADGRELANLTANTASTVIAYWNPLTYRGYIYDRETGWYYLQSRYYDPIVKRFLNADGYASTGQGFLGYNMFAYCGNNPVIYVDPSGGFWEEIFDFIENVAAEASKEIEALSYLYAGCGGFALADGPAPFGDIVAAVAAAALTGYAIGYGIYQAVNTLSIPIPQAKEEEKVTTAPQPSFTVIYRYGVYLPGVNPAEKLTPTLKDLDGSGLSFRISPARIGSGYTTIEMLNSTGVVYAVRDGVNHVSVYPIGGTMEDWYNAGSDSIWTQAVLAVTIPLD